MKDFDRETQEVRSYVRQRMSSDLPPSFVEDVIKNVVDMPQRRRSRLSSPLIASIATVAVAVAVVGIGLSLVNRSGFGTGKTPTPSASGSSSAAATPLASVVPSLSTLPAPSAAVGAFGPSWRMTPDEAFQPVTTCENLGGLNEFRPDVAYRISMPGEWFHGTGAGDCMFFGPEPFEPTDPPTIPDAAAIWITEESSGIPFQGGSVEEYTVDGNPAVRYEIQAEEGGIFTEGRVVWIIGVASRLPFDAVYSPPILAISTSSNNAAEFEAFVNVLDRMVATLVVLQPQDG